MNYRDDRTPVVWAVGDMVVVSTTARYLIINVSDLVPPAFSMLDTSTSKTVMTRSSLAQLKIDFTTLYTITEVIKSSNLLIVSA